jgi:hypothetical protein
VIYTVGVRLITEECINCGVLFAMSDELRDRLLQSHENFYCPSGHSMFYSAKSDIEKERDLRLHAEARAARAEDAAEIAERRRRAAKGQLTKMRNRIANGVCPWCKRSFSNVMAHVETQHPEHVQEVRGAQVEAKR